MNQKNLPFFDQAQVVSEEERARRHAENRDINSHLHEGGIFDPSAPHFHKAKTVLVADDEDQAGLSPEAAKRKITRINRIEKMVEDVLVNRVQAPTGVNVMSVSFDEFVKMRMDPEFESFGKYAPYITHYVDRNNNLVPRDRPVRAFAENEMGIWRGRIVTLKSMPGDSGRGDTPYVQVPLNLEAATPLPEKDPFPSPSVKFEFKKGEG